MKNHRKQKLKLWQLRLLAIVVVPLFILALAEIILRLAGIGHSTAFLLSSSNHGQATFVQNNKFGWRFFGERKSRAPGAISILQGKPRDVTRIFVFGESAAFGDPEPAFGLPRVLQATLSLRHPGMKFEVVNAAMTAINSHVIVPIARDCVRADGDIWVVYMGNNEVVGPFGAGTVFGSQSLPLPLIHATLALKATRLGQMIDTVSEHWQKTPADKSDWGGMLMFTGQQVPQDDRRLANVYRSFEKNLADIIRTGRDSGAGVVVSTVAVNLKDCPPFAGRDAESEYSLGRRLLAQGDMAGAQDALNKARDLDTLRFRCDSRLNELVRKVAASRESDGILLADAEHAFAAASPDGLPGWDFFYEHVHLTFEGNCLLARTLAEQIDKLLPRNTTAGWPTAAECARRLGRSNRDVETAITDVIGRLTEPPFTTQINHDEQLRYLTEKAREAEAGASVADALQATQLALQMAPDDAQLYLQESELEQSAGDQTKAEEAARHSVDLLPSSEEAWSQVGFVFVQEKKFDDAVRAYQQAFDLNPTDVWPLQNLALSLVKLNRTDEAMKEFKRAIALTPRFGLAWLGMGELLESMGRKNEAADCYQKALQNRIHRAPELTTLARFCLSRGWLGTASTNYNEAMELNPFDPALALEAGQAHFLFGSQLGKSGQAAPAAREFQEAVRLMPNVVEARLNLGIALFREKQWDESRQQFEQVAARSPTNAVARHYLGLLQKSTAPPE